MHVLSLDTASETCGVALLADDRVRAQLSLTDGLTHAQGVMAAVDALLGLSGLAIAQIDLIVVNRGPGSFTGLRIGAAVAKGLALALEKPLIGVSSLETLAHQNPLQTADWVCPMLDARRGQVYWALYERCAGEWLAKVEEQVGPAGDAAAVITHACAFIGSGAALYADNLRARLCVPSRWVAPEYNILNPGVLARLGVAHWRAGRRETPENFVPTYIRKSDARLAANRI
jgi:tRNA threonylcarbamoyladenosine biosynthesis protein TsaB